MCCWKFLLAGEKNSAVPEQLSQTIQARTSDKQNSRALQRMEHTPQEDEENNLTPESPTAHSWDTFICLRTSKPWPPPSPHHSVQDTSMADSS